MMMRRLKTTLLSLPLITLLSTNASAALISYTHALDFASATSGLSHESFEGTSSFTTRTDSIDFGAFTASSTPANLSIRHESVGDNFATDGSKYLRNQSFSSSLTLSFDAAINAFALDITGWGVGRNGTLTLDTSSGDSTLVATGPRTSGETLFFGFTSDTAFSELILTSTSSRDSWAVDNLFFGSHTASAPEPSSFLLFGTALIALRAAGTRRLHKRHADQRVSSD